MGIRPIGKDFRKKDVISIDQFSGQDITLLFSKISQKKSLKGKVVSLLFFEPSSRTFSSFAVSVKRLGGSTIDVQNPQQTSSLVKGESFEDMIRVFDVYSDAIVIRHPEKGMAEKAANAASCPVFNAGDGIGEHPTQALLDLYTIYKKHKKLKNLKGLIVGDLINGRTVHSLLRALSKFEANEVFLLSPESFSLPKTELKFYASLGIKITTINDENDIPKGLDFWYWTRIQTERLKKKKVNNKYILRKEIIDKYASSKTIFMHPLPRVGEILKEVDSDPRSMYLKDQLENGVLVRSALLSQVLS